MLSNLNQSDRVKSYRPKSYPGDTWIGLEYIHDNGNREGVFGVYPVTINGRKVYKSDQTADIYRTLGEAKADAARMVRERAERDKAEKEKAIASGRDLVARECDDGRIVFTAPTGETVEARNIRAARSMVFDLCDKYGCDVIWA